MCAHLNTDLRLAEPGDAPLLGFAALAAGGGIYEHLLAEAAGELDEATVLASAIAAGTDGLSWRNAIIAAAESNDLGAAIAYPAPDFLLHPSIARAASANALADLQPLFDAKPDPSAYYLHAIWTADAARGRGVGALLLDAVMAMAADTGFSHVALHVWADNTAALKLYESRGFRAVQAINVPWRDRMPHNGGKLLMQA